MLQTGGRGWGLQRQKFMLQRLKVQDQGVTRVSSFRGPPPWRAGGRLLLVSSHGLPSVCIYVCVSSSYKDTGHPGLGPTLITSF